MPRGKKSDIPEDPLVTQKKLAVLEKTDAFCSQYLNAEYKRLTKKLVEKIAHDIPSPLLRGRPEIWAAGVVHALGSYNFLFDRSFKPYISAADLAAAFDVASGTVSQKATQIRDRYNIHFPNTEFAMKHMKEMAGNLDDMMAQMGIFMQEDGPMMNMGVLNEGAVFADQFKMTRRSSSQHEEFVDSDHEVMTEFYDLTEVLEQPGKEAQVRKRLERLIVEDPDYFDTYLMLADFIEEDGDKEQADGLRETAYQRALARIVNKKGEWPKSLEWGWLENRHIIRALQDRALRYWKDGDTNAALELFRKLLRSNPHDNIGARNYILAIRLGETLEQHEKQFEVDGDYLDAKKMWDWFEKNSALFPDEFGWWREAVKEE